MVLLFSCLFVSDSVTPWTVICQAPMSMEFSRQEYRSGLPFPTPGDLTNSEIEPAYLALASEFFTTALPGNPTLSAVSLI